MYVCPHCHEEIPDRVRHNQSECPFCREPWPPEERQDEQPNEPTARPAAPEPKGLAAATPAMATPDTEIPATAGESSRNKKGLVFAVAAVLLVAAAGGLWWWHSKSKKTTKKKGMVTISVGGEKVTLKEYYADDYARTLEWYDAVRKQLISFLADPCEAYQRHRFHVVSKLVERERLLTASKKLKTIDLDVTMDPRAKAAPEGFDWFKCPFILAYVHKEHAMTIRLSMTEKERVLGSTLRRAVIRIEGGRFVLGKGTYKSNWDDNRAGLFFPMLKKLDPKKHPGIATLSGKPDKAKPPKHLLVGNIEFEKVKKLPGKSYLAAEWKAHLASDKFLKLFRDWTGRCRQLKRSIKETNDQYPDKEMRVPALKSLASEATRKLCQGLVTIATGLDPWNEAKVQKGAALVRHARDILDKDIRQSLENLAKEVQASQKPKPLCGKVQSPTNCTGK